MSRRGLVSRNNTWSNVWADSAHRSTATEEWIDKHGFDSRGHRGKPRGEAMPEHIANGNATRSKIRFAVEHVFAERKSRIGLFARTIGLARAKTKIVPANRADNMPPPLFDLFQRLDHICNKMTAYVAPKRQGNARLSWWTRLKQLIRSIEHPNSRSTP